MAENNQSEREKVFNRFPGLFENNETIKDTEINIQLKREHYPVKQKARPVPLRLQKDENCFVSPVVITTKSDKPVKRALDSRKMNDSCIKMRPHMPNMQELLS